MCIRDRPYYNKQEYIHAMSATIVQHLKQEYDHILFSFNGIPERHLKVSDPPKKHCPTYETCCEPPSEEHATRSRHQCLETMRLVAEELNIPKEKYSYSFQSRLGREPWLNPYTDVRLK